MAEYIFGSALQVLCCLWCSFARGLRLVCVRHLLRLVVVFVLAALYELRNDSGLFRPVGAWTSTRLCCQVYIAVEIGF